MTTSEQVETGISQRVRAAVDINGHPCLILAEHIAAAAQRIIHGSFSVDSLEGSMPSDHLRPIQMGLEQPPVKTPLREVSLTKYCNDPDQRTTDLKLAAYVSRITITRQFRRSISRRPYTLEHTYTGIEPERPLLLLAYARRIGIPILKISQQEDSGSCEFVTRDTMSLTEVGDVTLTDEDLNNPRRKQQLQAAYKLLNHVAQNNCKNPSTGKDQLEELGTPELTREVFGEPDITVEHAIGALGGILSMPNKSAKIATTTHIDGIDYPVHIQLKLESIDDGMRAVTTYNMPASNKKAEMPLMPPVRIYPYLSEPFQFEGVDEGLHLTLKNDLIELLNMPRTAS